MTADEKQTGDRRASAAAPCSLSSDNGRQAEDACDADASDFSQHEGDASSEDSSDLRKGARSRRRRVVAGIVAAAAFCLIVFSSFNVFEDGESLQTAPSLQTAQNTAENAEASAGEGDAEDPEAMTSGEANDADDPEGQGDSSASDSRSPSYASDPGAASEPSASSKTGSTGGGSSGGPGQESTGEGPQQDQAPATVTVSVSVTSAAADGSVSGGANPTFAYGATAYDALCATGLSVAGSGGYVSSIGGLAERDSRFGTSSGWMYLVNGSFPNVACNDYVLQNGDAVQWMYVM